jgi:hypothetical protein
MKRQNATHSHLLKKQWTILMSISTFATWRRKNNGKRRLWEHTDPEMVTE